MERKNRMLAGLAAAVVITGALAGGGVALAGTGGSAPPAAAVDAAGGAAVSAPATSTAPVAGTVAKGGARFLRRARAGRLVLRTAAGYLGITPARLRTQLRAGKSLAAVAAAQGKPVSGLENAVVAAVVQRIDASKLTAARKAVLTADVKANVAAFVTAVHPFEKAARRLGRARGTAGSAPAGSASAQAA